MADHFAPGDPLDESTPLGPLVSEVQRRRVRDYIAKGLEEGARLVAGGAEPPPGLNRGWYVRPTVFSDVTPEMTIAQEEIFGPVLVLMPYEERTTRYASPTTRCTDWPAGSGRPTRRGPSAWPGGSAPGRSRSTARRSTHWPRSAGTSSRGTDGELGPFGLDEYLEVKSLQL